MSATDLNRAVRLHNAFRIQEAQNQENYEIRSQKTNIFELLKECHRLSVSAVIEDTASERISSRNARTLPYPQNMRVWRHFPELGDTVWEILGEEENFQYRAVFPSPIECDLSLEGAEPISSAKSVHEFRHQTAHRYMRRVWREIALDQNLWKGWFEKVGHNLVDHICFSLSQLDFKIERNADNCMAILSVGRQQIPLFVIQYVAPQFLPLDQVVDGFQNLRSYSRTLSAGNQLQSAFLAAVIRAFSRMVQNGIWRGVVDTGKTLIFLKISKKNPQVLKIYHEYPDNDLSDDMEHDYRRTVVGEYISLALSCLQDNAPSQQWWKTVRQLDACKVNTMTVSTQLSPLSLNPLLRSSAVEVRAPVIREYATNRFCTAKCLIGLLAGTSLDPDCPNSQDHGMSQHEITASQFSEYFQQQVLSPSPRTELQPLHIPGNHNHYLRGVLDDYGYTFLVKVPEIGYEDKLQEEFDTYLELDSLQGHCIPVCVGLLDIKAAGGAALIYHGMEFEKMMIIGWEGVALTHAATVFGLKNLEEQRTRIRQQFEHIGVQCPDLAWSNLVWNARSGRAMLINFRDANNDVVEND